MKNITLGIGETIDRVHSNPLEYVPLIALAMSKITRQILKEWGLVDTEIEWEKLSDDEWKEKNGVREKGPEYGPVEYLCLGNNRPTRHGREFLSDIRLLISAHARWMMSSVGLKKAWTRAIFEEACMLLLWDAIRKAGFRSMAHYIHDTPHIGKALDEPTRLTHIDHNIIPINRIDTDRVNDRHQIWIGHDIGDDTYEGWWNYSIPNSITELRLQDTWDTSKRPQYTLSNLLRGDRIHHGAQTLVFQWTQVGIHDKARKNGRNYEFPLLRSMRHGMDEVVQVESEPVSDTAWHMHRITGNKKARTDGSNEPNETTEKITLCVHTFLPEKSFITASKRYRIDRNSFIVNAPEKKIMLLTAEGIKEFDIPYSRIVGVHKYINVQYLYFLDTDGKKKRMRFEASAAVFEDCRPPEGNRPAPEDEFFEEKKK